MTGAAPRNRLAWALATVFGAGLLRPAPGTWGSLAALPLLWLLHQAGGFWAVALGTGVALAVGLWAIAEVTRGAADHDPGEVVIDELVGQWLALWPVSFGAQFAGADILALWPGWIAAFILFRLFDIWKPGPVGWADRRSGTFGVMFDDVFAGLIAGLLVIALGALAHLWLLG